MTTETTRFKMNGHWFQRLPAILIISQMWMAIVISAQNLAMPSTTPTLVHSALGAAASNSLNNCSAVKGLFEKQGFSTAELPIQPIADIRLAYCDVSGSGTCCTKNMESKLSTNSRVQLEHNTKEMIGKLASVLSVRANRFNEFFKNLLSQSKAEFHEMFKRTYGIIYEQNSYVFSELFTELESYYLRGKVDLAESLDTFFNVLYQKMFTVLNAQYTFDDKYLGCVSEHMKQLKPFGDVPEKLTGQVKRSFVATRTFEQALISAAEVAKNMANLRTSTECTAALTKMQQCGACKGFTQKPCSNYCVNVMRGCLNHFLELDIEWDNFVQAMDRLTERLLGPFNIVMVVEPINIKISEAIMNFQETGNDISQQIFNGCGRPQLNSKQRRRRSPHPKLLIAEKRYFDDISLNSKTADDNAENLSFLGDDGSNLDYDPDSSIRTAERYKRAAISDHTESTGANNNRGLYFEQMPQMQFDAESSDEGIPSNNKKQRKNKDNNRGGIQSTTNRDDDNDDNKEAPLDKLVKDIRSKVKDSKKFWSNLPYQVCNNDEVAASPSDINCWNGIKIDRYPHVIATDQTSNPEFSSLPNSRRSTVEAQLYALRTTNGQLRNAYNGHDVEWSDTEETYQEGSGSGSGGGSIEDNEEGSGLGPIDYPPDGKDIGGSTSILSTTTNTSGEDGSNNGGSPTGKSDKDIKTHYDGSESNNVNKVKSNSDNNNNNKNSGSSAVSTNTQQMSLKRALFTYFLPIYLAWFGGLFAEML